MGEVGETLATPESKAWTAICARVALNKANRSTRRTDGRRCTMTALWPTRASSLLQYVGRPNMRSRSNMHFGYVSYLISAVRIVFFTELGKNRSKIQLRFGLWRINHDVQIDLASKLVGMSRD